MVGKGYWITKDQIIKVDDFHEQYALKELVDFNQLKSKLTFLSKYIDTIEVNEQEKKDIDYLINDINSLNERDLGLLRIFIPGIADTTTNQNITNIFLNIFKSCCYNQTVFNLIVDGKYVYPVFIALGNLRVRHFGKILNVECINFNKTNKNNLIKLTVEESLNPKTIIIDDIKNGKQEFTIEEFFYWQPGTNLSDMQKYKYAGLTSLRGGAWLYSDKIIDVIGNDTHEEVCFNTAFNLKGFQSQLKQLISEVDNKGIIKSIFSNSDVKQLNSLTKYLSIQSEEFLFKLKSVIRSIKNQETVDKLKQIIYNNSLNDFVYDEMLNEHINLTKALIESGFIKIRLNDKTAFIELDKLNRENHSFIIKYFIVKEVNIKSIYIKELNGNEKEMSIDSFLSNAPVSGFFSKKDRRDVG